MEKINKEVKVKIGEQWINIWDVWGARLERGAYEALLTPPELKLHVENKSRLEHGTSVLVNAPRVEERNVSFSIMIRGKDREQYLERYNSFVSKLQSGWFELKIPAINSRFKLLYESCTRLGNYGMRTGKFSLRFREPDPTDRKIED